MPASMPSPLRPGACLLLFILLAVGLGACDSSSSPEPPLAPNFLDDGESWTYETTITQRPVDSTDVDTTNTAQVRLEVRKTGVKLGGRSGLIQLNAFRPSAPEDIDRSWYQQSPDSLVDVAYHIDGYAGLSFSRDAKSIKPANLARGLTGLPLLVRQQLQRRAALQAKAPADTIVREDSRVVLQGPLKQGATWTVFRAPFLNRRTVIGDTTVETLAGQFDVLEVQSTGYFGESAFQWSDFYSEAGLVKRVFTDTLERRDDDGTVIGDYIFHEVHTLTDQEE